MDRDHAETITRHDTPLPAWFDAAFSHLDESAMPRVRRVWFREPLLRELAARLDRYKHPDKQYCPYCGSTDVKPADKNAPEKFRCLNCQRNSSRYRGTPFAGLHHARHPRLYAVLLTLWGEWRKEDAVWLSDCADKSVWDQHYQRLEPLLRQVNESIVTSPPRFLLGFLPGQMGLCCPECQSSWLAWVEKAPATNPLVRCEDCRHQFAITYYLNAEHPSGTTEDDQATEASGNTLPGWFRPSFSHIPPAQYQHLCEVWFREPMLRALVDKLDAQNPAMGGVHECIGCGHHGIAQYSTPSIVTTYYYCPACKRKFSEAEGTIFYNIPRHYWRRFYTVLVTLWASWRQIQAVQACQLKNTSSHAVYRKRLRPLIEEAMKEMPVTLRPRKMLGFTASEQGVRCLRCGSTHLVMEGVTRVSPENPLITCRDCNKHFRLHHWLTSAQGTAEVEKGDMKLQPEK